MVTAFSPRVPAWFKVTAVVLVLWGLMGCVSLYMHLSTGPGPGASAYDRQLYASMPLWLDMVYAGAVGCGLAGAIALALRRGIAVPLSALSLVLVAIQFGWMFLATDIVAVKGAWVTYFPAMIAAIQAVQLLIATKGRTRGWLR